MPSPEWWSARPTWPSPPLHAPGHAGPDQVTLRPCGCHLVFGHYDHVYRRPAA